MEQYLVVISEGGIVQSILPFKDEDAACETADKESEGLDPEEDDVVVWDLKKNDAIYNPFHEEGGEGGESPE